MYHHYNNPYLKKSRANQKKAVVKEVMVWLWGTVQGEFNEEQTVAQILTDAGTSLIPVYGEITDVRDIIAVVIRMIQRPESRKDITQWALLVVLFCALIPVVGVAVKGVGRLLLKGAAHQSELGRLIRECVDFLNKNGWGNAEEFLLDFSFSKYAKEVFDLFMEYTNRVWQGLEDLVKKREWLLPTFLINKINYLIAQIKLLQKEAAQWWGEAVNYLDKKWNEVKGQIFPDGKTTSKASEKTVPNSEESITRTDEMKMDSATDGAVRKWHKTNQGLIPKEHKQKIKEYQKKFPGFDDKHLATFCKLPKPQKHKRVWRVFGPGENNKRLKEVPGDTTPTGVFYGVGEPPATAKEWRERSAVLDEWNSDKYIMEIEVVKGSGIEGLTGPIARQDTDAIEGTIALPGEVQRIRGGGEQAFIPVAGGDLANLQNSILPPPVRQELQNIKDGLPYDKAVLESDELGRYMLKAREAELNAQAKKGTFELPPHTIDEVLTRKEKVVIDGEEMEVLITVRPTGWTDANGIHGWVDVDRPVISKTTSRYLAQDEIESKEISEE